ncbi:MAG: ABC transporter permease subunit [Clostridia bacterium]|nr:ABC transporter permease subunit [Clostridia bacterium]
MKAILTIIKKEFARFFKDTRLMLTALILPGLLIYAVYSLIGTITQSMVNDAPETNYTLYIEGLEDTSPFKAVFDIKEDYTAETADEALKAGELDLIIAFPAEPTEKIQIIFNSSEMKSQTAYYMAVEMLANYSETDVADAQSTAKTVLKTVVPMVLIMLLFSGCMAVAPESIAGEKERGTIATLLVTPVKRSSIAIGKIAALSVIALLSGLSSALGLMFSLPNLTGGMGGFSLAMYGVGHYAAILLVVLSTVLILVTLISIISAFAKSVKEASGFVVPLMILVMVCGLFSMFVTGTPSLGLYFIPLFNSALAISTVLSGAVSAAAVAITVCTNVVFAALLVFVLTLMFKSEKFMFKK